MPVPDRDIVPRESCVHDMLPRGRRGRYGSKCSKCGWELPAGLTWQPDPIKAADVIERQEVDEMMANLRAQAELNLAGHDPVNHPSHYTTHPSGIEAIEITRHHNFAIGSAIKYLWRAGLKDGNTAVQDLQKAVWYITDEIARLEADR